ncbi:MAG: lytic transglycosylase domain-containing protein [Fibrobacter sp.]|nr:lytic transglycosylase domain-containing protein [Fibrobacter sp.]
MENVWKNPWLKDERSWVEKLPLWELSQGRWMLLLAVILVLISGLGIKTWRVSVAIRNSDAHVSTLNEEYEHLMHQVLFAREYTRLSQALNHIGRRYITPRQQLKLTETLWQLSRDYRFDPLIVLAVMQVESRANPAAVGRYISGAESGALGLMQVKLSTAQMMAKDLGIRVHSEADLFKSEVNMLLGTYYLMRLVARTGDLNHALMAYNIGPAGLQRALVGKGTLPKGYVQKTLKEYYLLCEKFGKAPK